MKKLFKVKLPRLSRKKSDEAPASRITNETVAEHREKILAGGRKFKYPVQYSKHRLVVNSMLISIASILILTLIGWWQLYPAQNTSKFMYRLTQVIPVPVATVDGEWVRYSDYLKKFRSSLHFLEEQNNLSVGTTDGKRQVEFIKRRELDGAIYDAYITKLSRQHKVNISDKEVEAFVAAELTNKKVSAEAYERTVLNNFYDWSLSDYRTVVKSELLKRKLSATIDKAASDKRDRVMSALQSGQDFATLAQAESDDTSTKQNGGDMGSILLKNIDPNGVVTAVRTLQPGQYTIPITGADGYYIAKLTTKTNDSIQYSVIKVGFGEVQKQFNDVKNNKKIKEFIKLN